MSRRPKRRDPEIPAELWGLWDDEFGWHRTDACDDDDGAIAAYTSRAAAEEAGITDDGGRRGRPVRIGVAPGAEDSP